MKKEKKIKFGDWVTDGDSNGVFISHFNRYKSFVAGSWTSTHHYRFLQDQFVEHNPQPYVKVFFMNRRKMKKMRKPR